MSEHVIVDEDEVARRIIEPNQFVADTEAFVDVRLPRSQGKASYSLIGPGVSQNLDQVVNLQEPHGFNVGAAAMPNGVVNNPHLHYTAEVFICTRGRFEIAIGRHGQQKLEVGPGDVFAAPTWVFRGFTNIGPDDGWMFVVLGGDDTGGILWSPDVLREAAATGMYLGADNALIDRSLVGSSDELGAVVEPLSDELLEQIDSYSDDELRAHAVRADERSWSARALLSSVLEGHRCALAPVLGHGIGQDRSQRPPITSPSGFSLEWLRVEPGNSTGVHRIEDTQVLLLTEGDWQVDFNRGHDQVQAKPAPGSAVSIPPGAWRNFANSGARDATALIISGTDAPNRIEWDSAIVESASDCGWGVDAGSKLAPIPLLAKGRA